MPKTIEELLTAAKADATVEQQLRSAASAREVATIAASHGFTVTTDEVEQLIQSLQDRPVSEEELNLIAGGGDPYGTNLQCI